MKKLNPLSWLGFAALGLSAKTPQDAPSMRVASFRWADFSGHVANDANWNYSETRGADVVEVAGMSQGHCILEFKRKKAIFLKPMMIYRFK